MSVISFWLRKTLDTSRICILYWTYVDNKLKMLKWLVLLCMSSY